MAQSDLKFSWGAEGSLPSGKVNGKAYFATTAAYPLLAASANKAQEAFIYFDKDGIRYNVISKRALQDALGNNIIEKYATNIESAENTMTIFAPGANNANDVTLDSAVIINSISIGKGTTHNGSTYHIKVTANGKASADYALAHASGTKAGIISTGDQTIAGAKTFSGITKVSNETNSTASTNGALIVAGGLGVAQDIYGGGSINIINTLTAGGDASIGGNLTVVGKNIFFGNTAKQIITASANAAGTQFTIGNDKNHSSFLMTLFGPLATSNGIELWRGSNSSWKMVNDGGHLRFFNNYTTSAGDYFKVLELEYNTGNANLKGNFKADTITINNKTGVKHLEFTRQGYNYITAPSGGNISFVVGGQNVGDSTSELTIVDGHVYPGTTNVTTLGKSSYNFSNTYTRAVTSDDALTIGVAASKAITFKQSSNTVGSFTTAGSLQITKSIYPGTNNSSNCTLGSSSLYWHHTYSTNFTGTDFNGTTFTGTNFNGTTFTGGTVYATTLGVYKGTSVSDRATLTYDGDTLTLTFA